MTSFRDMFASLSSSDEGSPASEASISDPFAPAPARGADAVQPTNVADPRNADGAQGVPVSTGSASSCPAAPGPATPAPQPLKAQPQAQVQAPKGRAKAAGPKRKAGRRAGSAPSRSALLADFRQPESAPPEDEAEAARGRMTRTQKASHAAKVRWAGHVAATSRLTRGARASSNQRAQQQNCQQVHAIAQ